MGQSRFSSPRLLTALLLCVGACFLAVKTLPAFFQGDGPAKIFATNIELYRTRSLPTSNRRGLLASPHLAERERPDPKPSLDAVMSQAQIEKKVDDYLRKSQALEDYWQRPISSGQLQAEMERIASQTKQPGVLRELFAALGNDPLLIAECLARPVLAERLLTAS